MLAGLLTLMAAATVVAHGAAYLVVEPTTISPGGEGAVRGAGFGPGNIVALVLVTPSGEVPLGSVEADGEGSFSTVIRVPTDTAEETVRLEARSPDHMESAEVTIAGAPADGGGDGRREEEEPLLAPISFVPAQGARAVPRESSAQTGPASPAGAPNLAPLLGVATAVLLVTTAGGIVARRRRRRRSTR